MYHNAPREEVLQLLRDHITENIVKASSVAFQLPHSELVGRSVTTFIVKQSVFPKAQYCLRYCAAFTTVTWKTSSRHGRIQ